MTTQDRLTNYDKPRTYVRVMFGQRRKGCVTASLEHGIGPLVVGETVMAYELDDGEMLYAPAKVTEVDQRSGVALLLVDQGQIRIAEHFEAERPLDHFKRGDEELRKDALAIPA